jgi:FtsP/CotA-like multicopper oxidase with cupredoxin domain
MKYAGITLSCALLALTSCDGSHGVHHEDHAPATTTIPVIEGAFTTPLPAISTMPGTSGVLAAQTVRHDAGAGTIDALGYGPSGMLGPTLLLRSGERLSIRLDNGMGEATNLHWHGLTVPPEQDGHPDSTIAPAASKSYSFPVQQRAGLYWYHPHAHGTTAKQAYRGLAGLIRVADAAEEGLQLPSGKDEHLLVLQDKRFSGRSLDYSPSSSDVMDGFLGETILVNGAAFPVAKLRKGWSRLRILNGSNARVFNLAIEDGTPMRVIGTDGGLLDQARTASTILLGPGERVDVLVDLSRSQPGTSTYLRSAPFAGGGNQGSQSFRLLKLIVDSASGGTSAPVMTFPALDPPQAASSVRTRVFEMTAMDHSGGHGAGGHPMGGGTGMHRINGKVWDPRRIDDTVVAGTTETWEFRNPSDEIHPVHIHGMQFALQARSGGRATLQAHERGWKDTFLLLPGETVRATLRFPNQLGLFLLHCHNLEHEDDGMMLQFLIRQ